MVVLPRADAARAPANWAKCRRRFVAALEPTERTGRRGELNPLDFGRGVFSNDKTPQIKEVDDV
jgi:hypothetical protein